MKALLLFHFQVGVRIAIRAFAPLFCAFLALIMLQMYPAAVIAALARAMFSSGSGIADLLPMAFLAFILPAWAAPRLSHGLQGWIRHLSISSAGNRRGLALALFTVQLPLMASLAILALVAHRQGLAVGLPSIRWGLVLLAGAIAALPVRHRAWTALCAIASAALALSGPKWLLLLSALLLTLAEFVAGSLRKRRPRPLWHAAGSLLAFRIGWRAAGAGVLAAYGFGLAILAAGRLFIVNNQLEGALAGGAARFAGAMAVVLFLSVLSERLGVRRPVWPLARSFPWSGGQRVLQDALFLGVHALPLILPVLTVDPAAGISALGLLPVLCLRAAGHMRRIPERRTGAGAFVIEGFVAAALLALLPWSVLLSIAACFPVFHHSKKSELHQKVTRWLDLHHAAAGDTHSWSE